jgi:prevent-host-death family protein
MSLTVTVEEVKERFEELVAAAAGRHEEIVVASNGTAVARVVPLETPSATGPRVPGCDRGRFTVPPEFFEPLSDEILDAFEGKD